MTGFGVARPWQHSEQRDWWPGYVDATLGADFCIDYKHDGTGHNYVPMIFDASVFDTIRFGDPDPEQLHLFLNEPEREGMDPKHAAALGRLWKAFTGTPIGLPGIIVDDPGYAFLVDYINADGPVPELDTDDVWTAHFYVTDGRDFRNQWGRWRRWMKVNDLERPTWITETACITESEQALRSTLAAISGTLLTDPLCEAAAWFSVHYGTEKDEYKITDLLDAEGNVTNVGRAWLETRDRLLTAQGVADTTWLPNVGVA